MTSESWAAASALPPLHAKWVGALLGGPVPSERKATCESCAMCPPDTTGASGGSSDIGFYSPVTKCCTYLPELANFLVGGIVSDDSPDAALGRGTVEERIRARVGVTPLGLGRSKVYTLLYGHGHRGFGRAKVLECPHHLPDGRCGVWRHRESTCATWFCKHERGEVGKEFWRRLHDLLAAAELTASRHCVVELGVSTGALERLFPPRALESQAVLDADHLDGLVEPRVYEALWGEWVGRETELYRRSADIVAELTWDHVLALGGLELAILARFVQNAYERMRSESVPERLRHRRLRVLSMTTESVRLETYSPLDPMSIPRKLFDVLPRFDGKPVADTLEAIETGNSLRLSNGLVRKLVDFGILGSED